MSEQQPPEFDLAQELRELGEQLKRAIQVARDHPQTKQFEQQVMQAFHDLSAEIDRALKSAREDERVKKTETHVREAVESIKEGGAKEDLERGLAKGVRALNEQIRRAIEEVEKTSRG